MRSYVCAAFLCAGVRKSGTDAYVTVCVRLCPCTWHVTRCMDMHSLFSRIVLVSLSGWLVRIVVYYCETLSYIMLTVPG